ncbi:glucose-1-phosphate thymidylyltransferase [Candidatus Woesearchaeota archaeon CG07_land_8_20_14_0_80_44_23]|nr:MAG: glucose-1-phosphate thymidylyltransferase [Candidatus Woesearchaeota archaeon CG07_land_8_20_14_0_80_44_23]
MSKESEEKIPVVILAAGKSTRTYPLTITRPKTLLKVANKEILVHNIEAVRDFASELIVIVGFQKEMIMSFLGSNFSGIPVRYVEQKEQLGTGHALMLAKEILPERFMVMMSDDLYCRQDVKKCVSRENCILAKEVPNPECFGVIVEDKGIMKQLVEKPKDKISNLANCALYILNRKIFDCKVGKSARGEYELTDMVSELSKKEEINVERASFWMPITYPWSILDANEALLKQMKGKIEGIEGIVESNATLKGQVFVGKGTVIKSGSYIEGPVMIGENCRIGPNCYIRPSTTIGNNCHIGNAVEIKNSVIFDNSNIAHLSYIGDSIIGYDVNIGAGTIIANLRHDNSNVKSMVNGMLIDSGRRKLGAIIGDNVHTGINTSIYPGRKIWPGKSTIPGEIVKEDITQKR